MSVREERLHTPQTALLYYDFLCDGYPFFTLDTRTQRFKDDIGDDLEDNHLLGLPSQCNSEPGQLDRLTSWLIHQQERRGHTPKFIVSSSVFVPNPLKSIRGDKAKNQTDSWPAFPATRRKVLDCIVENRIQNVVFLSGDIHNSNVARIKFNDGPGDDLTAYSITSSAFYWPFPFADGDPSHYVHDADQVSPQDIFELSPGNGTMAYRAWGFTQTDNFCRIDIKRENAEIAVSMMDHHGETIATLKEGGSFNKHPQKLKLTQW
jgi:alkaline phosphatase D